MSLIFSSFHIASELYLGYLNVIKFSWRLIPSSVFCLVITDCKITNFQHSLWNLIAKYRTQIFKDAENILKTHNLIFWT